MKVGRETGKRRVIKGKRRKRLRVEGGKEREGRIESHTEEQVGRLEEKVWESKETKGELFKREPRRGK